VCQGPPGAPRQVEGHEGPHTEQVEFLRGHGVRAASARHRLLQCRGLAAVGSAWVLRMDGCSAGEISHLIQEKEKNVVLVVLCMGGCAAILACKAGAYACTS